MAGIVVISDRVEDTPRAHGADPATFPPHRIASCPEVAGSYLERLPLAAVAAGAFEAVEVWHHCREPAGEGAWLGDDGIVRRVFHLEDPAPPFDNRRMAARLRAAPPALLLVYGLGVSEGVLDAAGPARIVYNSIDAPALRVPEGVSARCDMILTGAPWQAEAVVARHPGMSAPVLPVGPEFAAIGQFHPTGAAKTHDLVYVAAAQGYKRHDILFDALERLGPGVSALCVFGYGERAEDYRNEVAARGLTVDCVMPPVRPYAEVNALMNRARIGIVAGVDDGAPAILTEYMLAGLPVLANADLTCGTQYILPETGMLARADDFADAIVAMLGRLDSYRPRPAALSRWSWPVTIARFLEELDRLPPRKDQLNVAA